MPHFAPQAGPQVAFSFIPYTGMVSHVDTYQRSQAPRKTYKLNPFGFPPC